MEQNKVAVIGAGLMGRGIAQTCAQAGYEVVNVDVFPGALEKAEDNLNTLFDKKVQKGKMTEEEKCEILGRISYSSTYEDVKGAYLIVEAVPEKIDIKKETFANLDQYADEETILVSNTSGLSISEIAAATKRPHKVMGVHFFYPAPVMKLAELIRGLATSDDTYRTVREFTGRIKKTIVDAPEFPGFMVNRILVPMQNEAAFMVMEGCRPEDVDNAMKLGANHPMGPLELTDFVGVDVMLATMTGLYEGFHDSKYRPCPLLETMVKAGHLGRKSGRGFYKYE
ncbi:3-hydroxybutyryl-CoA dehydrogenase [Lactonifactor sp. BIOML-A3]|uniref:3-hydroxyacyl-CoA dehydrogenase family protein n=1 Tax=unclassified Lactonifactor TaxID=2636670 RepID=UPI0012B0338D|nr:MULTISPECIES: 3-hydroxyacyl-CoA dehydrogenase NAD-binding domain-containing protein [unclassified Lactonifactor]MSA00686.1 3-hydroxybutyryl-CoA dehydrogenase [Lactonifactor sp. BIOML-A5]MSA06884.1 3-hydroxybutyryl-CoA dehydrogenase [Lactonifactor sp. BIOML-A4]MSA11523.1 3-hydroxybutyryl-CoA dehydrogenase [Lactonifactor sp. BIOML-A3]MSA16116.1 3-hydroxybutyryl-CoA dehydrogenase [Lactonifactor sp. BIOML-A2]MSA36720.1 3-hydroxybutyryl-CoA dehydrogenase [Lactonifactor sp. BIOML-A1]